MNDIAGSSYERAQRFVDLHAGDELFVMANPTTIGVAQMLERLGYPALGTSSAALARSYGRRDGENALTRVEAIDHAKALAAATTVPISGDFENGYGDDPSAVAETVRASIDAGLAGCCIEDATGRNDQAIYDPGLAAERIAAGAEAIGDAPFVLVARAENFLHGRPDLHDTVARLQSFEAAGATAVYAPGFTTLEQVSAVVSSVGIPVNVLIGMPGQMFSLDDLAQAGVRRVSVGSGFERVANAALRRAAEQLLDTSAPLGPMFSTSLTQSWQEPDGCGAAFGHTVVTADNYPVPLLRDPTLDLDAQTVGDPIGVCVVCDDFGDVEDVAIAEACFSKCIGVGR